MGALRCADVPVKSDLGQCCRWRCRGRGDGRGDGVCSGGGHVGLGRRYGDVQNAIVRGEQCAFIGDSPSPPPERHIFTSVLLCNYAIYETLSSADESLKRLSEVAGSFLGANGVKMQP